MIGTSMPSRALRTTSGPIPAGSPSVTARGFTSGSLFGQLFLLEQVFDAVLLDEEIRRPFAIHFDGVLVIPLDPATDLLTVGHDDDDRRPQVHLLDVIKILSIRDVGRRRTV